MPASNAFSTLKNTFREILNLFMVIALVTLTNCEKKYDFEGVQYQIKRGGGQPVARINYCTESARILSKINNGTANYIGPDEAIVALSKVIFPSKADAQAIMENATAEQLTGYQFVPIDQEQYEEYSANAIVAYNESTDNPMVVTLDNPTMITLDTLDVGKDDRFWGMISQIVYYEFKLEDFRIRWYCNNSGNYRDKDVIIKKEGEANWKFIYDKVNVDPSDPTNPTKHTYTIALFDTRQENIFFWVFGDAGIGPSSDTLSHITIKFTRDLDSHFLDGNIGLSTFGKTSTAAAGGGFGRVADDIIGFTISVIFNLDPGQSGTFGLMYSNNIVPAETGKIRFSDIDIETSLGKQLCPIKTLGFDVEYDIAD